MSVFSRSAPVTLRVRFVSGKQSYEFEEQSLRVPNRFTQWFNVAVVSGVSGKPSQSEPEDAGSHPLGTIASSPVIPAIARQLFRSTCRRPPCPSNRYVL